MQSINCSRHFRYMLRCLHTAQNRHRSATPRVQKQNISRTQSARSALSLSNCHALHSALRAAFAQHCFRFLGNSPHSQPVASSAAGLHPHPAAFAAFYCQVRHTSPEGEYSGESVPPIPGENVPGIRRYNVPPIPGQSVPLFSGQICC